MRKYKEKFETDLEVPETWDEFKETALNIVSKY